MSNKILMTTIGAAAALMMATNVSAGKYKVVDVSNGGSISGKISFKGTLPSVPDLKPSSDQDLCGNSIPADYYIVDASGGLKNAVVAIEKIDQGKAYEKKGIVALDNKKCMFVPHVATAVKGQKLGINNSDPVLHNTHLYHGKKLKTMYNIALPLQNRVIKKPLRKDGVVTIKCDAHDWMLGYVYVSKNPYSVVTAADGSFTLSDVPAGSYKVKVWHEKLGESVQDVTVAAGSAATLNHSFSN